MVVGSRTGRGREDGRDKEGGQVGKKGQRVKTTAHCAVESFSLCPCAEHRGGANGRGVECGARGRGRDWEWGKQSEIGSAGKVM